LQHNQGIKGLKVFVKEGEEFFEYVWELVGFSHDTNEHWELAQVFVHASEVGSVMLKQNYIYI
jgi:hypothetical protein